MLLLSTAADAAAPIVRAAPLPAPLPRVAAPLRFDRSPEQMRASFDAARTRLNAAADALARVPPAEAGFATVIAPYTNAIADFIEETLPLSILADVSTDPDIREAGKEISESEMKARTALGAREDLYAVVAAAAAKGEALDEQDKRLLEETLDEFKTAGHGMAPADRLRLRDITDRLSTLNEEFEENLREDRGTFSATEAELAGVPPDVMAAMKRAPDGRYLVSLDMATVMAVITSARDPETRRRLELADQRRALESNPAVISESLALRAEEARLNGFPTFGHMTLDGSMAGTPERVASFLGQVREAIGARAERDRAELLARKRVDQPGAQRLESWDRLYYEEVLKRERFGVDPDQVRRYFPLDRVLPGVLRVYERMLGVSFKPAAEDPVWHPDARAYDAHDAKSGRLLGRVYLDLVTREDKYGFVAMVPIINGRLLADGTYRAPTVSIIANFPRAAPGRPSLLTHGDVETLFHEMGHVMHELLTEARHASMAGSEVTMDFAEMPSQIMENLAWDPEVLAEVSGHVDDGSPLPAELLARMVAARSFQRGMFYLRQLTFAVVDQVLHAGLPVDLVAAANKVIEEVMGFKVQEGAAPIASYEYMLGDYEAYYYGYMWSEVYSEDAWRRFKREGLAAAGADFRREILTRGSGRPEADSLRAFLGREPSLEAFIAKLLEEPTAPPPPSSPRSS